MIKISMPKCEDIEIKNLVLDYNGTLAKDGYLIMGVAELIRKIARSVNIYVITANTFGSVHTELRGLPVEIRILQGEAQESLEKLELIKQLDSTVTVVMGNGNNDKLMLKEAGIGICIIGQEGCSTKALSNADLAVIDIITALELLIYPDRLKATMRN